MTFEYSVESAKTANFPPLFVSQGPQAKVGGDDIEQEISALAGFRLDQAVTTRVPIPSLISIRENISSAILDVNRYLPSGNALTQQQFVNSSLPPEFNFLNGVRLTTHPLGTLSQPVPAPESPESRDSLSSTAKRALAILLLTIDKLSVRSATDDLNKAREAAKAKDMRLAYRHVYRGLDRLFRRGKWEVVSSELAEMCKDTYPAAFGIGAMRFSSEAAKYIPVWNNLLSTLASSAQKQGMDVGRVMRGLLNNNGNP